MEEVNEDSLLFSQIEYFRLMQRVIEASREQRAEYIRLEQHIAEMSGLIDNALGIKKKPFKFFQGN